MAVHHAPLLLLAMLACDPNGASAAVADNAGMRGAADTHAGAHPTVRGPAGEAVQSAVAAVLVATLAQRFDGRMEDLRLDQVDLDVGTPGPVVHGRGAIRLDGGEEWLAFRFHTRYDPVFARAGYPEVELGGGGEGDGERHVPNDAALVAELESRVAGELGSMPGAGPVRLRFDRIRSVRTGDRFLHIDAGGLAYLGSDGHLPAEVQALYDLHTGSWLDVGHALVPDLRPRDDGGIAGP